MNFLKKLFDGGQRSAPIYKVYVQPKMCQEMIAVRVNLHNDLSRTDDYRGFWVRKVASATRCPFQVEITLYFDDKRTLTTREIENGRFVTEADYHAFVEKNK